MGYENSVSSSGNLQPLDIKSQIETLVQAVKVFTENGKPIRKYIAYISENVAGNYDGKNLGQWNNTVGGYLSDGTIQEIGLLKEAVKENLQKIENEEDKNGEDKDKESKQGKVPIITSDLSKVPICAVQKWANERRNNAGKDNGRKEDKTLPGKNLPEISTYRMAKNEEDGQPQLYILTASFQYDRNQLIDTFTTYQTEDEDEDWEEEKRLERKKRQQRRYAKESLNLSQVLLYHLRVWAFCKIVDDLTQKQKELQIAPEQMQQVQTFAKRLREFSSAFKEEDVFSETMKFNPEILNLLPVIVNIKPENKIADSSTEDTVDCEFVVTLKLDMEYSSSREQNPNCPSKHYAEEMSTMYEQKRNTEYKQDKFKQGYLLWHYLAYGRFPKATIGSCTNPEYWKESMKNAKKVMEDMHTEILANVMSKTGPLKKAEETFYLHQFRQMILPDANDQANKINAADYFCIKEKENPEAHEVPVSFLLRYRSFMNSQAPFGSGRLCQVLPSKASYFTCLLLSDRVRIEDYGPLQNEITKGCSSIYVAPHQNQEKSKICTPLYDILVTILTTTYLYVSCEKYLEKNKDKTIELLLPRLSIASKTSDNKIVETAGSADFMTAFGRCLEQGYSKKTRTHTQGYIATGNSSDQWKSKNAAHSLLSTFPWQIEDTQNEKGIYEYLQNQKIAVLYLTGKITDTKKKENEKRAILASESILFCNGIIKYLPRTNDWDIDGIDLDQQTIYDIGGYSSEKQLYQMLEWFNKKVQTVLILMDTSYMTTTTFTEEQDIVGISRTNIQKLEEKFPNLQFFPMFLSTLPVRDNTGKKLIIRNLYQSYPNTVRIPLDIFLIGKTGFGKQKASYYRSGCLYETMRNYYEGRTGQLITEYLDHPNGDFHKTIEAVLLLLHIITDERATSPEGEGKIRPFDRLKNEIMPSSTVTYRYDNYGRVRNVNYLGLITRVISVLEKKE